MKVNKFKMLYFLTFSLLAICLLVMKPNTAHASETVVNNWAEFKAAYENSSVTKISLGQDIERTDKDRKNNITKHRTTSLEIDGSKPNPTDDYDHYKLHIGDTYLGVLNPTETSGGQIVNQTLHVHDVIISNYNLSTNAESGSIFGLPNYTPGDKDGYTKYWNLRLGNIVVPKGDTERVARFTRGQVTMYGKNKVSTKGENFYVGGMKFEDNTEYYGNITKRNYSVIWFRQNTKVTDSGSSEFEIGKNSDIKLRNVGSLLNTTYPAIYQYFSKISIGENSKFTATVPGSALQFHGDGQTVTAEKGSVVTLTSLARDISLKDSSIMGGDDVSTVKRDEGRIPFNYGYATNLSVNFKPGSSLFVIGGTNLYDALISLGENSKSSNNTITLDSPLMFDIRNNSSHDAVQVNKNKDNQFKILNSNLSFWKAGSDIEKVATFDYPSIESFKYNDLNEPISNDSALQTDIASLKTNYRTNISRISGLNSNPDVLWSYQITNADKNLSKFARVRLGSFPDNDGLDEDGNLHYLDVYAGSDIPVNITDTSTETEKTLKTDDNGFVSMTLDDFYPVGTRLTAIATRGKLTSEATESEAVFDITPPTPATVGSGKIFNTDKELHGEHAEAGAIVSVAINRTLLDETVTVNEDGTFTYPLSKSLSVGDKVTIYLQDHAGKAPDMLQHTPAPLTNTTLGNINPEETLKYSDATFPAATSYTVEQGKADLTIQFEDEAGNIMSGYTLTVGDATSNTISTPIFVGDVLNLTKAPFEKIQEQLKKLESAGYEIVSRPTNEQSFMVSDVKATITYKVKGLLFLKNAPSVIDFGSITYNAATKRVDNPEVYQNLVITDTRANKANGWTLYASLTSEMTNTDTGSIMGDALRYVRKDGNELTLNTDNQAVYTTLDGGSYNITKDWGTTSKTPGLKLVADPSKTTISNTGSYSGSVTWTIIAGQP